MTEPGGNRKLLWMDQPKPKVRSGRVLTFAAERFLPRRPPRLEKGQEFTHPSTGERWRVTDVGTRTFLAINLSDPKVVADPSWANGPPYAVVEHVWDETDYGALLDVPGIEWDENNEVLLCEHPEDKRLGFFPGGTNGGHERCTGCGCVRYQAATGGPWGDWEFVNDEAAVD